MTVRSSPLVEVLTTTAPTRPPTRAAIAATATIRPGLPTAATVARRPRQAGAAPDRFHVKTLGCGSGERRGCRHGRERERQREGRLPGPRLELNLAAHELGKLACDRQPEAASGRDRAVDAVEAFEDMLDVLGRDSRAVVLHREQGPAVARRGTDADRSPGRRVQDGVVDKDAADLDHALLVCGRRCRRPEHLEGVLVCGGDRAKLVREHLRDLVELDRLTLDMKPPRVEPVQIEQVGREPRQTVALLARGGEKLLARVLVKLLVVEQLEQAGE